MANDLTTLPPLLPTCFRVSRLGVEVSGTPTIEEYTVAMRNLRYVGSCIHWWIGDLLNAAEVHYGEGYSQVMDATGYDYDTVRDAKWVSAAVGLSVRTDNLSFYHHRLVAKLDDRLAQKRWLSLAVENDWSVAKLREAMKGPKPAEEPDEDEEGGDAPEEIAEATTGIKDLRRQLLKTKKTVTKLSGEPGGERLHVQSLHHDIDNVRRGLIHYAGPCPYCLATGVYRGDQCTACKGTKWVDKATLKQAPKYLETK